MYSILSGDPDNSFAVDPASGALSTTGPLDREKYDTYILLVRVSDLLGNHSYGIVFDDSTVVEVVVEVSGVKAGFMRSLRPLKFLKDSSVIVTIIWRLHFSDCCE